MLIFNSAFLSLSKRPLNFFCSEFCQGREERAEHRASAPSPKKKKSVVAEEVKDLRTEDMESKGLGSQPGDVKPTAPLLGLLWILLNFCTKASGGIKISQTNNFI